MRSITRVAAPLQRGALAAPASRRSFATGGRLLASYGFIGLGRMGKSTALVRREHQADRYLS
jgi:hypothetical protein